MGLLLGLDLGTTGCKAVVCNDKLDIAGESYLEYELINKSATEIEQDADEWWELAKKAVILAVSSAGADIKDIRSVSISSQGIAFVPVDENCMPLSNAISWLDTRASAEADEILERFDRETVFKITGKRISAAYTLPKLIWFKKNMPEIYDKTHKFLMPHDFMIAKLSGRFVTDRTMASGTLAFDIIRSRWWEEILDEFGIDKDKLPEVIKSGTAIGRISPKAAAETGLSKDLLVCTGGQDQKCAALGAGIDKNSITVSLGTATAIEKLLDSPKTAMGMKVPVFSYLFDDSWIAEGVIGTSGLSLKWFRNLFCENISYKKIDEMIENDTTGSAGVLFYPYLGGSASPYWYANSTGCFHGMDMTTSSADLARSVLEGIAFNIRSNIAAMGGHLEELRVFGGGASSDIWCRIISDITNTRVQTLKNRETACIGACILAGLGAGLMTDAHDRIKTGKIYHPDKKNIQMYDEKFEKYVMIQKKIMS